MNTFFIEFIIPVILFMAGSITTLVVIYFSPYELIHRQELNKYFRQLEFYHKMFIM